MHPIKPARVSPAHPIASAFFSSRHASRSVSSRYLRSPESTPHHAPERHVIGYHRDHGSFPHQTDPAGTREARHDRLRRDRALDKPQRAQSDGQPRERNENVGHRRASAQGVLVILAFRRRDFVVVEWQVDRPKEPPVLICVLYSSLVLLCTLPLFTALLPRESALRQSLPSYITTFFTLGNFGFLFAAQRSVGKVRSRVIPSA